jgi:CRP-like cAMP-binding protein
LSGGPQSRSARAERKKWRTDLKFLDRPADEGCEGKMTQPLRNVRLFEALSDIERTDLVRFMHEKKYATGETVCTYGEYGNTMLVVTQGALSAVVTGQDARAHEIARLTEGAVFGEMFCIDPAPRPVTLLASEPTTVLELGREDLIRMRQHAPHAAAALVGAVFLDVLKRLRSVDERIDRELCSEGGCEDRIARASSARDNVPGSWKDCFGGLRGSA